jgi:hypothetical protein
MGLYGDSRLSMTHNRIKGFVVVSTFGKFSNKPADGFLNHILYRDSWIDDRYQNQTCCHWQFFQHAIILLFLFVHELNAGPKHRVCLLKIDYDALCIIFGLCKIG